jgi:hypothetical protein
MANRPVLRVCSLTCSMTRYSEGLDLQEALADALQRGNGHDTLLLLQVCALSATRSANTV